MKCRLSKCNAQCCYNIAFNNNELERFKDKIVNPVLGIVPIGALRVAFTSNDMENNKCPFLRHDYKCNIYENRPDVCRKFGEIDRLPCRFIRR